MSSNELTTVLMLFGGLTAIVILVFMMWLVLRLAMEAINNVIMKYKFKHRFDKPPTAKCYCVDCRGHDDKGYCDAHSGWRTADDWFCWCAEPRKK